MANLRDGLLLGCGNPLLDISATVDDAFLAKYDMLPNNAILAEDKHMPIYKELVDKCNAEYIAGGSVQNSFRVAQWVLQRPKVAVFFGCVGKDKYSEILSEKATGDGVNVQYQYCKETPTGTCAVLITGTQRSLCANLAAANNFTIDHLKTPENEKFLKNAEFFYISGFFLTVSVESILTVAKNALSRDKLFMMNLSAPFIPQFFNGNLEQVFPYIDILFGNETETLAFAQTHNMETEDLKQIGLKIAAMPKQNESRERIVIITQGSDPVLLVRGGSVKEFPVEKLELAQIVDTNGAGDAFVGGFLAQLVQGHSYDICIKCGIWAARQIIQRSGCTFEGVPDFRA
ncbi:uncharacterized protein LOC129747862 [Uranotaenia lowii]|uniref:uncharacterized protein LOC129747862 n=1 Tax=Uranotaenia lowii TaxID=190385 RepID=UPI00247AD42A|nr:uncharacterized protein LOC129747862 [Uranotaenia lowii]XP_055598213.1 uncharacterized protein LOC129747862 [Uranotaenia lowii]